MIKLTNWLAKEVGLSGASHLIEYGRFSNDTPRCLDEPPNKSPALSALDTSLHTLDSGMLWIQISPGAR